MDAALFRCTVIIINHRGVRIRPGDLDDAASLEHAFEDASEVLRAIGFAPLQDALPGRAGLTSGCTSPDAAGDT